METQPLDLDIIRNSVNHLQFGRNFIYRTTVDSTNTIAKQLIREGSSLPLLVCAEEQTHGKGRLSRSWFSPQYGGIWLSIAFPSYKNIHIAGQYNYLVSVCIARAVEQNTAVTVNFKWPNDLLISNKKVCGILSENISKGGRAIMITGAGLNVNIDHDDFTDSLRDTATSVKIESGAAVDRSRILVEIIRNINTFYDIWQEDGIDTIFHQWIAKCSTLGKRVTVRTEKAVLTGSVERIDPNGFLVLKNDSGGINKIYAGDLEYVIQ